MKLRNLITILALISALTFVFTYCGDDDDTDTKTGTTTGTTTGSKTGTTTGTTTGTKTGTTTVECEKGSGTGTQIATDLWDKYCLFKNYTSYAGVTRENVLALGGDIDYLWCVLGEQVCNDTFDTAKVEDAFKKVITDERVNIVAPIAVSLLLQGDIQSSIPKCGDVYKVVKLVLDLKDPNAELWNQVDQLVSGFGVTKKDLHALFLKHIEILDTQLKLLSTLEFAGVTSETCEYKNLDKADAGDKALPEVWTLLYYLFNKETDKTKWETALKNLISKLKDPLISEISLILHDVHGVIPKEKLSEVCSLLSLVPDLLIGLIKDNVKSQC